MTAIAPNGRVVALSTKSATGILLAQVENRWFAITFGHGWQRIDQDAIETNFGIRCVLNLSAKDSLKSIRRDRIGEESIQAIEQIPDTADIFRFGMDIDRDLLRGVRSSVGVSAQFGDFGKVVSGTDSFKTDIDLAKESIGPFLARCLRLYGAQDYKQKFAWIDKVSAIRDPQLIDILTTKLARAVSIGVTSLTLCVPELLAWDQFDILSFEQSAKGKAPVSNDLDLQQWRAIQKASGEGIDANLLTTRNIYAYKQGIAGYREKWTVLSCIHGTIKHAHELYLTHGGSWFKLAKDFVEETEQLLSGIDESQLVLPNTTQRQKEGDYNTATALGAPAQFLCLDKRNIMIGGGQSRVEICDLLSNDGRMICVKPWGGSSGSLSHLFQQALVSTELITQSQEFRDSATLQISPPFANAWANVCDRNHETEIVLAILRGPAKERLPFFAKLSLVRTTQALRNMRFNPTYKVIPHR